ncbi:MAG: Hsp20/alpha crystallin family protein [Sphingobacteriia bacterium]|nr:Hsp20/alpha crystallin family protein [Sphingobacteriia bacterium]NCC38641.1 Hsp20/alpha crystallin family protein [Gammaproteobacteria bacterium]
MKTKTKAIGEAVPRRELSLFDEMDRTFDAMMHGMPFGWRHGWMHPLRETLPEWARLEQGFELSPRVDVIDREQEILVRAEVSGVEKDDLEIELAGQLLTLKGERKHEQTEEQGTFYRSEIARGSFTRSIRLPEDVDFEKTTAELKDGVLEIHLPKTERTERRRIEVA